MRLEFIPIMFMETAFDLNPFLYHVDNRELCYQGDISNSEIVLYLYLWFIMTSIYALIAWYLLRQKSQEDEPFLSDDSNNDS